MTENQNMWASLGFRHSPYDATPLKSRQEDVELLIGRDDEGQALCTNLDSAAEGVCVVSGVPGVGKTSFLNIFQFLLETRQLPFGPHLLAARYLCPIQAGDNPKDIALRSLRSLCRSISDYANINDIEVPNETKKVIKWLDQKGGGGFSVGLTVLGVGGSYGRQVSLPEVSSISFEGISDVLACIVGEVTNLLGLDGMILALDNVENLEDHALAATLMAFRGTMFSIPHIWWILVGQSGLKSLLQTLDPRVSDRLSGVPIELAPISLDELDIAIQKRVQPFHTSSDGKGPLPSDILGDLYGASHGEIRFVFRYSNSICLKFVSDLRNEVSKTVKGGFVGFNRDAFTEGLNKALGIHLVSNQLDKKMALSILQGIVSSEIAGLNLRQTDKDLLKKIGENSGARAMDFKKYGRKSMQDFSSNYLTRYYKQHLLTRRQEGRAVVYNLRGMTALAAQFGHLG